MHEPHSIQEFIDFDEAMTEYLQVFSDVEKQNTEFPHAHEECYLTTVIKEN